MADPYIATAEQAYGGETIVCAQVVCTEESVFKFSDVVVGDDTYQFQALIKSSSGDRELMVLVGDIAKPLDVISSFVRYVVSFPDVTTTGSRSVYIVFPPGVYYLYNIQLEHGNLATQWQPSPDDGTAYVDKMGNTVMSYADAASKNAVDSQTQLDVFNKLTNNGAAEGIYLEDGKLYINASYLKSGRIDAELVTIEHLIVDHLRSFDSSGENMLESRGSYLDIRKMDGGRWRQRVGIYIGTGDRGVIRLSSGETNQNGLPEGESRRSFYTDEYINIGVDENGNTKGASYVDNAYLNALHFMGDKAKIYTDAGGNELVWTTVRGGDGKQYRTLARDLGAAANPGALATTSLTAANQAWSFSVSGLQAITIVGQGSTNGGRQTVTIPYGQIGLGHTWGIYDNAGYVTFTATATSDTATIKVTSVSGGAALRSAWRVY